MKHKKKIIIAKRKTAWQLAIERINGEILRLEQTSPRWIYEGDIQRLRIKKEEMIKSRKRFFKKRINALSHPFRG